MDKQNFVFCWWARYKVMFNWKPTCLTIYLIILVKNKFFKQICSKFGPPWLRLGVKKKKLVKNNYNNKIQLNHSYIYNKLNTGIFFTFHLVLCYALLQ